MDASGPDIQGGTWELARMIGASGLDLANDQAPLQIAALMINDGSIKAVAGPDGRVALHAPGGLAVESLIRARLLSPSYQHFLKDTQPNRTAAMMTEAARRGVGASGPQGQPSFAGPDAMGLAPGRGARRNDGR